MSRAERQVNRRIRLLLAILLVALAATLARAVWLQGVRAEALGKMARSQHRQTVTIPAGRGTIFDRAGVQLAIGEETTTIYANPRQVRRPRAVSVAAAKLLGLDANELYPQLLDRRKGFVYVQRFADPAQAAKLAKRGFGGLGFYPEERRSYPQRTVASQIVGYAGVDNRGLTGIEVRDDRILAGKPGKQTIIRDPFGRAIDVLSSTAEREGRDVYLTIDHRIQAQAEQVMRETVARWHARGACAVVLDPKTGEVYAMAQAPGYDANDANRVPAALQRNRAVTDLYEPGSTFKLVTVTGALSEGLVEPSTQFVLPYSINVADRTIHDAELRSTETMTVAQILSRSSNVGAITLAERLGPARLARWIDKFGFGKATGVDFPGESSGLVLPLARWSGSTIGNVPIGQGIAVTPIQMASVYAAVANGGEWVQPHLVDHVAGRGREHVGRRRIISPRVNAQIRAMLADVVAQGGTGTAAAVPGYTVAGKTGTAQKPDGHGGYSSSKYVASFVGMVPASKPRLVVLVMVDEPRGQIFGGVIAAPAFAEIAKFDLQYLEVPPDAKTAPAPAG
jgi:cell division protein FtsI (penicillin-binding protein 3)/stage V sporulation protein D (sporulation-specific penicillin-binding protein)